MKKIVLIGASGFIGSVLLKEALNRGYKVKAVVRNPEKITIVSPELEVVKADASSAEVVASIVQGADAVLSAYSPGWTNPHIVEDTINGYTAIISGVKKAGVKRLLIVGGAGTLFVSPGVRVVDSGAIPESYKGAVKALGNVYLEMLPKENELDWVFFSPAGTIEPGERTGKYRLGKDDLIVDAKGESKISVEDYAKAMIDELENPVHHRERFTIGY